MKKNIQNLVFLSSLIFIQFALHGQNFIVHDYKAEGENFLGESIQLIDNQNYIIRSDLSCYTPGYSFIHGCYKSSRMYEVNRTGEKMWEADVLRSFPSYLEKLNQTSNGNFQFVANQYKNHLCGYIAVGGLGLIRLSQFEISPKGEILNTTIYNEECSYKIEGMHRRVDGNIEIIAQIDDWNEVQNSFMILDKNLNVIADYQLPGPNSIEDYYDFLFRGLNNKRYSIQKDRENGKLNLITINDFGAITNTFPITDLINFSSVDFILLSNNDILIKVLRYNNNLEEFSTEFYRVSEDGSIKWVQQVLNSKIDIILEKKDKKICLISSLFNQNSNTSDVHLEVLNSEGNSLISKFYEMPERRDIATAGLIDGNDNLIILGNSNCCSLDTTIGPAYTFLLIDSTDFAISNSKSVITNNLTITPNPVKDTFKVEGINLEDIDQYRILTNLGELLIKENFNPLGQIDISNLDNGTYMLKLIDKNYCIYHKLIMKQ